jgi:hypothetical protein
MNELCELYEQLAGYYQNLSFCLTGLCVALIIYHLCIIYEEY